MRGQRRGHQVSVFSQRGRVISRRSHRVVGLLIMLRGNVWCWGTCVQRCGRYSSTFCTEMSGLAATETNTQWSPPARMSWWSLLLLLWLPLLLLWLPLDASAAAAVSRGAVKPTAVDHDDVEDLFRRVCSERCHDLHGPVEPHRRALAAASRPYTCGQGMGATDTVARPRILDPSQGFPQFIGVSVLSSIRTYFAQH